MRTFLACFVLAAAVATPGIVVAATSSEDHPGAFEFSATSAPMATPIQTEPNAQRGPINPSLRPAVNAVTAAFAAKGIGLTVEPLGGEAAMASALDPAADCPTVITFILESGAHLSAGTCSSGGSVVTNDGITITYTPASVGRTIKQALGLPGGNAG
jgi:hypothetical protein